MKTARCEKEKEKFDQRVRELYKKSKSELLQEFSILYCVHSADRRTPKADMVSGILDAEGWFD